MEVKELLELSENTFLGLKKIQKDIPNIEGMIADANKQLSKVKEQSDSVKEDIDNAEKLKEDLNKLLDAIKKEADASIKKIKKGKDEIEGLTAKLESQIESIGSIKDLEERLADLEEVVDNQEEKIEEFLEELEEKDKKIGVIEKKLINTPSSAAGSSIRKVTEDTTANEKSYTSSFPSDAYNFSLDNIQSVKKKKPYGIVIDGNIVKCEYWTHMIEKVIPFVFEHYDDMSTDELCELDLGKHYDASEYSEAFDIPYFIEGKSSDRDYRYITKLNLSVYYSGADATVDVMRAILCDYIGLDEERVQIFYHN